MATVSERASVEASQETRGAGRRGMVVPRVFSTAGVSPYDQVDWDQRTAAIKDEKGRVIFEQTACEVPATWSQLATNVVVSKYFYGDDVGGELAPGRGDLARRLLEDHP